jgi:hypothetical protein
MNTTTTPGPFRYSFALGDVIMPPGHLAAAVEFAREHGLMDNHAYAQLLRDADKAAQR